MNWGQIRAVIACKVLEFEEKTRLERKNAKVKYADERRVDDYDELIAPRPEPKPPTIYQKIGHNLLVLVTVSLAIGIGYLIYLAWNVELPPDPPRSEIPDESPKPRAPRFY